jgi:hypothetical protein
MHTDFVIPYAKDVLSEKGKVYAPDSNIAFMRSWYQKRDIQAIINKEKALMAKNKDYQSDWDLKLLADFMETGSSAKPADQMTPAEREKGDGFSGGFEVIHAFQVGVGAEFYSFSPAFKDGTTLRSKINKDPRGHLPLDFEYCNIDLSNPLGRGQVELSGGVQNLIDQQMQMFQFMTTIMQAPPVQVWGSPNKASMKILPNAMWDMGTNVQANRAEFVKIDSAQIANFPNNYGLLKSQIMNLNNSQDTSISSQAGNPAQSKTQAGVEAQQQRLGISDNYLEKQHEAWFQAQSETSLNIFFAVMNGKETIDIGEQDVKALLGTPAEKYVNKDHDQLTIPYKEIADIIFKFKVDAGSSTSVDDADQLAKLKEVNDEYSANPLVMGWLLGQDGKKLNSGELIRQRFERMGIKNLDLVLSDMSPEEAQAAKQAPFPVVDKPQFRVNTADLTAEQIAAVLSLGGVPQQPQQGQPQQPGGMPPGLSPQGMADFIVEMTKAQAAANSGQTTTDPNELAIKHRELDLKQQDLAIKAHDSVSRGVLADQQHQFNVDKAAVDTLQNATTTPDPQLPQDASATPNSQPTSAPAPTNDVPGQDHPLTPEEQQVVTELLQRGFDQNDAAQAITLLRGGVPEDKIIALLGAKRRSHAA